ncbi:hypothetical protein [Stenotrophomonas phage BUCT598]|uniref:Uncharacterized protein n=1 Tax=Stenotrophomonas phage BUCT598 TaxID=2834253 RepID=A0A8F2F4H9_9CAUD|nr:hypothetical protein [Stenotrophomonas phage BUCT598]
MPITVNRTEDVSRKLLSPLELVAGNAYRRAGATEGANYRDVIVVKHVDNDNERYILDLKDFRLSPPAHNSLVGLRFYESDIIINA